MTQRISQRRSQNRLGKASIALKAVSASKNHFVSPKVAMHVRKEKGGYGVFATELIQPGELLVMWGGMVVSKEALRKLPSTRRRHSIQVEENLFLVPHDLPEPGDFVNHSCNPNAGLSGQAALVSLVAINRGEEICYDYAMSDGCSYDEFECACGSENCRRIITGNDWMLTELQQRYLGHFSPYLMRRIETRNQNNLITVPELIFPMIDI